MFSTVFTGEFSVVYGWKGRIIRRGVDQVDFLRRRAATYNPELWFGGCSGRFHIALRIIHGQIIVVLWHSGWTPVHC